MAASENLDAAVAREGAAVAAEEDTLARIHTRPGAARPDHHPAWPGQRRQRRSSGHHPATRHPIQPDRSRHSSCRVRHDGAAPPAPRASSPTRPMPACHPSD
jgi:hypothetical protein